jgi:hypothetical protein
MKITNKEIYEKVAEITAAFSNETKYIPIKLNFAIQKNLATFSALINSFISCPSIGPR